MTHSTRGYAPPHRGDRGRASGYSASTGSHGFGTSALHNLAGFLSTVSAGDRGICAVRRNRVNTAALPVSVRPQPWLL